MEWDRRPSSPEPIKILIVDDHPAIVGGLAAMIDSLADFEVCGTSGHAGEALEMIERLAPGAAVVDLALHDSDGLELIRNARARGHRLPVLVLSAYDQALYAERALAAGANGYVHKSEALGQVASGLRAVLAGETFLSPSIRHKLLRRAWSADPVGDLSRRELDVFRLIGDGHPTRRIAELLNVSVSTVETHSRNIRKKLGLGSARDLVHHAAQWSES